MTHKLKEQPSSFGDRYCLSVKSRKVLVAQVSIGRFNSKKPRSAFFPTKTPEKLLRTSYIRGPNFNGSSTNAVFSVQETYCLNARVTTRATYNEIREICLQGTQPTRMQANQATRATACPLHPQKRQGPRRSCKLMKPPNQAFA
jgi:hypothetical protein